MRIFTDILIVSSDLFCGIYSSDHARYFYTTPPANV
jgi:hypothetical protein